MNNNMAGIVLKFSVLLEHLMLMGRNSRWPTISNHGARPCSSVMRRMRKKGFYLRPRNENTLGAEGATDDDELNAEGDREDMMDEEEKVAEEAQAGQTDAAGKGKTPEVAGKGKAPDAAGKGKEADSKASKDAKPDKTVKKPAKDEDEKPAPKVAAKGKK